MMQATGRMLDGTWHAHANASWQQHQHSGAQYPADEDALRCGSQLKRPGTVARTRDRCAANTSNSGAC
jgi:hypothetical protein